MDELLAFLNQRDPTKPPKIHLVQPSETTNAVLVLAHTKKWVCANLLFSNGQAAYHDTSPLFWVCGDDDTEFISSSCLLVSDDKISLVFGMDSGRVLCYEFRLECTKQKSVSQDDDDGCWKMFCNKDPVKNDPWEPLPLEKIDIEDNCNDGTVKKDEERFSFTPQAGVGDVRTLGDFVWILYANGSIVRVPKWRFFPSSCSKKFGGSLKCARVMDDANPEVVPLPYHNASLFASPSTNENGNNVDQTFLEALSYGGHKDRSLVYYSTEDNCVRDSAESKSAEFYYTNMAINTTKNVVKGALGAVRMLGAGWHRNNLIGTSGIDDDPSDVLSPLNKKYSGKEPQILGETGAFLDNPRRITSVTVDPSGKVIATADSLGRVMCVELESKQVVRMWKGFRDAECFWIQMPRDRDLSPALYIVIHARQRRVVEVYRMRHGPRVKSISVGRNAQIIQSKKRVTSINYALAACFILEESEKSSTPPSFFPIVIENEEADSNLSTQVAGVTGKNSTVHLQLLRQLLSSDTTLNISTQVVYDALVQIPSLSDLSDALDLLATSSHMEAKLGVHGSEFHVKVIAYATTKVQHVLQEQGSTLAQNPHVDALRLKIKFHQKIIDSYNFISNFDAGGVSDEEDEIASFRTPWAIEAIGWMDAYEKVSNESIDAEVPSIDTLYFSSFAKACVEEERITLGVAPSEGPKIHLCDSTKGRRAVLIHIFRPLVHDVFVFKVTNSIFECMGIDDNIQLLQKYFGEWYMSLPGKVAANASLFGVWCPILKWLQDLVAKDIACYSEQNIRLATLYEFCRSCDDLPRAFLLAATCREAVAICSKQKEEQTYGQVLSSEALLPWDQLLRKLRVLQLVSLRLYNVLSNQFPLTISNVEAGDIFSVYHWLAKDELLQSHRQDDIVALEQSIRMSDKSFNPSTARGDSASHWKALQKFCIAGSSRDSLLLYFPDHNQPMKLAAHRALLLGGMWGRKPGSLHLLKNAVSALRSLSGGEDLHWSIISAVRLELWQVHIRPVYRAIFFGFDDVSELSEDIMMPLCLNNDWLRGLSKIANEVLGLIESIDETDKTNLESCEGEVGTNYSDGWSLNHENDFFLLNICKRTPIMKRCALELHRGIIAALLFCDNLELISQCLPATDDIFLRSSLFTGVDGSPIEQDGRMNVVDEILLKKAQQVKTPVNFTQLNKIIELGERWGIPSVTICTRFVLAIYRVGKDAMVEDALSDDCQLDVELFVKSGVEIASVRLHVLVGTLKRVRKLRPIMAQLDADTCEWSKQMAEESQHLQEYSQLVGADPPSLAMTHEFLMRLVQFSFMMGPNNRADAEMAGALSAFSDSLIKLMHQHDQEERRITI